MTKEELLKAIESAPNDFIVATCAVDCTGIDCEVDITKVEINDELNTIYLHLDEEELYNL